MELDEAIRSRGVRPQQLFLTGDQIYADDVHPALLAGAQRVAALLVGTGEAELVQGELGDGFAAGRRASPLRKAGLSSGAMGSHLITLGEFIGMYLLVWSPVLWAVAGLDGVAALADFRASLPRVRRALAHIPTGMMFDDHEVTDDWNIRQSWVDGVGRSALGRRVVRNALAAYAVFQHWGNVPREFSGGRPGAEVLKALAGGAGAGAPEALDEVLGALPSQAQRLAWGWRWGENPLFEVVALDCRTRRVYRGRGRFGLMSSMEINRALALDGGRKPPFSIVISPTPVLGVALIEAIQRLGSKWSDEAVLDLDHEPWSAGNTVDALMNRLLYRSPAVVLSGDVHYGFIASAVAEAGAFKGMRFVNCVSSALKNSSPGLVTWGKALGGGAAHADGEEAPAPDLETRLEVGEEVGTVVETVPGAGAEVGPAEADTLVPQLDWSVRRTPVVAVANLGVLTWEGGTLRQVLRGPEGTRTDVATFPIEGS
ncbi:MAG: hypothetical protein R3F60_30550 [bacterium]